MKRKWIMFIVLIILVLVIISYNYIYQEHRDIESETVEFVLTSDDLSKEFLMNSFDAEKNMQIERLLFLESFQK